MKVKDIVDIFTEDVYSTAMQSFKRAAIVDRSHLAQNVYETILRPFHLSLLSFRSFRQLREDFDPKWKVSFLLVNSNALSSNLEKNLEWLEGDQRLRSLRKVFICDAGERKLRSRVRALSNSRLLQRPFYPPEFEAKIKSLLKGK